MKVNNIRRKSFSVNGVNYQMPTPAIVNCCSEQPACFKDLITELIWVQKGMDNLASYFPAKDIRAIVDVAMEKMQNNPSFIETMHKTAYRHNKSFFDYSKKVLKMKLATMSNEELSRVYINLTKWYKKGHNWAVSTTWFIDSDTGDFSNFILARLKEILAGKKVYISQIFSDLTTPEGNSFSTKEEKASLRLLEEIKKDPKVKKLFLTSDLDTIKLKLKAINLALYNRIIRHKKEYSWLSFGYIGPAYDLDYFLSVWQGLLKENFSSKKRIKEIEEYATTVRNKRQHIFDKYKIQRKDRRLFNIAADIIHLKAYRKDSCYLGLYAINEIMKELAKRLHLSLRQVGFMASWEVPQAFRKGEFPEHVLNERMKFSVYHQTRKKGVIYIGKQAKDFLKKNNFEKTKINQSKQLVGMTAYPGKAIGVVKIVNVPEDMVKMEKGNILVAHTTAPALLPAMKKAAAIVTDDGGITCHAAIVSRELKKPCIVGIKTATQVLKDNDRIEVDADNGVLNILKQ